MGGEDGEGDPPPLLADGKMAVAPNSVARAEVEDEPAVAKESRGGVKKSRKSTSRAPEVENLAAATKGGRDAVKESRKSTSYVVEATGAGAAAAAVHEPDEVSNRPESTLLYLPETLVYFFYLEHSWA